MRGLRVVATSFLTCAAVVCSGCLTVTQQPATLPVVPTLAPIQTQPPIPTLGGAPTLPRTSLLPTLNAGQPTLGPTPASQPTVTVIFDTGADAGTHVATGDPGCAYGILDAGVWSVAYGNLAAGPSDLSEVQISDEPDSSGKGNARIFSAFIVVGPVFGGRNYTLSWDRFSDDTSVVYDLQDNTTSATIHFVGTSTATPLGVGGVKVDLTIDCPTVKRS